MERKIIVQKVLDSAKSHSREALAGLVLITAAATACGGSGVGQQDTSPNDDYTQLNQLLESCPNFPSFDGGDAQACGKLTVETIACLDGNLLGLAVNPNETIERIAECVASYK